MACFEHNKMMVVSPMSMITISYAGDGTKDTDDGDNVDDDDDGYPAHSHHDKFPPWWDFDRDDDGGNLSVTKSHH